MDKDPHRIRTAGSLRHLSGEMTGSSSFELVHGLAGRDPRSVSMAGEDGAGRLPRVPKPPEEFGRSRMQAGGQG